MGVICEKRIRSIYREKNIESTFECRRPLLNYNFYDYSYMVMLLEKTSDTYFILCELFDCDVFLQWKWGA